MTTSLMKRSATISSLIAVSGAIVMTIALAACGSSSSGGGGGGGGPTGNRPVVLSSPQQVLDVRAAVLRPQPAGYDPASAAPGELVFKRIPLSPSRYAFVGVYEVTQAQWRALTGSSPWEAVAPLEAVGGATVGDRMPAFGVSYDAIADALSAYRTRTGWQLRLLTDGEWATAALAGSTGRYGWGDGEDSAIVTAHAVVRESAGAVAGVREVGGRASNAFGLHDMHGNVWEWIVDGGNADGNVLRGGSWSDNLVSARGDRRQRAPSDAAHGSAGLRLVLVP